MANRYYSGDPARDVETYYSFGIYSGGALQSYFSGLNILCDQDTGVLSTFSAYSATAVSGYFTGATPAQVYGYPLNSIKRAIYTFTMVNTMPNGYSLTNIKSYPMVVYLQAQGCGGPGGNSVTNRLAGAGGGGSGYNDTGFVVLQPGDSLSSFTHITASRTAVTVTLTSSSLAYTNINGARYVGNGGTMTLTAAGGSAGGTSSGGRGYRNGGDSGAAGGSVAVGALTVDGYATQSYNAGGSAPGAGGGGGASLVMLGTSFGRGGNGASIGYTVTPATAAALGAGGGGRAVAGDYNYGAGSGYNYASESFGGNGALFMYTY